MFLWSDGFDTYSATADLLKTWLTNTGTIVYNSSGGRWGGGCIQMTGASTTGTLVGQPLQSPFSLPGSASNKINFSCWFKCTAAPTNANLLFGICTSSLVTSGFSVQISTGGVLQNHLFYSGTNDSTISNQNVCDGAWHHLEWQINCVSSPTVICYLDGNLVQSASVGGNGGGFSAGSVIILGGGSAIGAGKTLTIDDLLVWDTETGLQTGELTTFPLGPLRCRTGFPTGAGTNTNWVPDSGSNYARVNEVPADDDTSYIEASASGTRDSYTFGSFIPVQDLDPIGTIVKVRAKNTDAGSINAQGLAYSGGNYGLGDSKLVTSAYTTNMYPIFRDPSTSAAWTNSGINAAEFGVGIV